MSIGSRKLPFVLLATVLSLAIGVGLGVAASSSGTSDPRETMLSPAIPADDTFGAVVGVTPLPEAAEQPRDGAKVVIDLVSRSPKANVVNTGIRKLGRFLNIHAAAGAEPTQLDMVVVLHGPSTLVALDHEAYAQATDSPTNPNLEPIQRLGDLGVRFLVCGQSLAHSGFTPDQVAEDHVTVAVSAFTSIVNKQAEGYSYLPMN